MQDLNVSVYHYLFIHSVHVSSFIYKGSFYTQHFHHIEQAAKSTVDRKEFADMQCLFLGLIFQLWYCFKSHILASESASKRLVMISKTKSDASR